MKNLFLFPLLLVLALLAACGSKDDDGASTLPTITADPISVDEGSELGLAQISVRLSSAHKETVTVDYSTTNRTAKSPEDFIAVSGSLSFAAGETSKLLQINYLGDEWKEADETFEILFSNPVNATLAVQKVVVTLLNDDVTENDAGYTTPDNYDGYNLVWQDEFNGTAIDASNWVHELGNSGWGNNELQNYTPRSENSFVSNGKLVIEAKQESLGGAPYTSARMKTQGLREFQYGRIDIRAKLPTGKGIWPALWMLGDDIATVGWPKCGEIDIMEIIGSEPATLHGTVHWDNGGSYANYGQSTTLTTGIFADEYHVFTIIWDDQFIRWLLDDVEYNVIDITPVGLSEFHNEFFFLFNIAVGGNWPGSPDGTTVFPQQMKVDYVRVFQEG
ncbi:MAG: family 16 glycosylhydrolase [Saprospiraceae bacterium]|jgi:beta-glucanase (GH16 family)|nr:family 16 glycosylhydrolase [Saprospiraceae bacterium]